MLRQLHQYIWHRPALPRPQHSLLVAAAGAVGDLHRRPRHHAFLCIPLLVRLHHVSR